MGKHEAYAEDEITCPYCGYQVSDSWTYGDDYGEAHDDHECEDCGKKFHWSRDVRVTYSSSGKCEANGIKHEWRESEPHRCNYDGKWIGVKHCDLCGDCELLPVNQETGKFIHHENTETNKENGD